MWHRVAALLGSTVAEAQQRMSSQEFVHWCALYDMEPWGYHFATWRMGMICATVGNAAGRKKPLKPSDFYPRRSRKLTSEESRRRLEALKKHG
jgi:hypothetical protein